MKLDDGGSFLLPWYQSFGLSFSPFPSGTGFKCSSFSTEAFLSLWLHSPFTYITLIILISIYPWWQFLLFRFFLFHLVFLSLECISPWILNIAEENLYCRPVLSLCNWVLTALWEPIYLSIDWVCHADTDPTADPLFDLSHTLKISR